MTYGLGIDLGTTFTAVAIGWTGRTEMVSLGNRSIIVPTIVHAGPDGRLLTGDAADRRALREPDRAAREFKRRLGDPTPVLLGDAPYSPAALLAAVLRDAVASAIRLQGSPPARIVLTRPAVWGPYRLEQFDEVPRLAGLTDVPLVTEPVAAATYYAAGQRLSDGDVIAVYDLGGGTFDAAVLRMEAGEARVLGVPEGIEWLGGADFDEAILHHVDRELDGAVTAADPRDRDTAVALSRLRQECVLAKEALSADEEVVIPVDLPGARRDVKLGRAQFEEMIRPAIASTVEALHRALGSAEVKAGDLSGVLLAGGSSRIPAVARTIEAALQCPTIVDAHPKHVVALGAARIAAALLPPRTEAEAGAHAGGSGPDGSPGFDGRPDPNDPFGFDGPPGPDDHFGPDDPSGPDDSAGSDNPAGAGGGVPDRQWDDGDGDGDGNGGSAAAAGPAQRARARRRRHILAGAVGLLAVLTAAMVTAVLVHVTDSDAPGLATSVADQVTQRPASPSPRPLARTSAPTVTSSSPPASTAPALSIPAAGPSGAATSGNQPGPHKADPRPTPSAAAPPAGLAAAPKAGLAAAPKAGLAAAPKAALAAPKAAPAAPLAPAAAPAARATAAPAKPPSTTWTFLNVATHLCLDSNDSGSAYTMGCNNGDYQRWTLVQVGGGYQLKDLATSRCAGARANPASDGTRYQGTVFSTTCDGQTMLVWRTAANAVGYQFTNVATGECLDSNGQGRLYTQDCNGGDYQHWTRS
ncbi:Hsp70 family protein [Frankia gtarii]|uniref:Hsp70 family protein n=1 Tax=Frankia gtarii TaxID=2950102 RepID=UPI0021BF39C6|nr:Hsp70 family protein [Frankia gtarii]